MAIAYSGEIKIMVIDNFELRQKATSIDFQAEKNVCNLIKFSWKSKEVESMFIHKSSSQWLKASIIFDNNEIR